tara:strand:- start:805 stop:1416 length:612 start_codon:yes stop_codon:yes gene_type:complete
MFKCQLDTGDIILCKRVNSFGFFWIFDLLISLFSNSPYVHCALVLRNPTFIHPSLKGLYVWQSSWEGVPDPQDDKIKLGVQLTKFDTFEQYIPSKKFVRVLETGRELFKNEILKRIHETVYDKPYDINPIDWIEAIFQKDIQPQKTSRFWCSAFVGFVLVQLGLIKKSVDWSILRPCDLSSHSLNPLMIKDIKYSKDTLLISP